MHAGELVYLVQNDYTDTALSADSERVFSLLNNTFNEQEQGYLEDYVETPIMLQYNTPIKLFWGNNEE